MEDSTLRPLSVPATPPNRVGRENRQSAMGNFEPLMSFNLPELLAVDLEESKEVFKSRQLTAGAPAPALAKDESKRRYSLQDGSLGAATSSHPLDLMSRAKSLQNVYEKQTNFLTISHELQQNNSDSDSASSESSGGLVPPSIGTRDASVATAATSVTSEKMDSPIQLKPVARVENHAGESWMDLDAEEASSSERRHNSMVNIPSPVQHLALRSDMGELRSMSLNSAVPRPKLTSPSTPTSTTAKSSGHEESPTPVKKPLMCPTSFPKRRSSLLHRNYPLLPQINISPSLPASPSRSRQKHPDDAMPPLGLKNPPSSPPRPSSRERNAKDDGCDDGRTSLYPDDDDDDDDNDDDDGGFVQNGVEKLARPESCQTPQIAPPSVDVESWLESSVDNFPYYAQTRADGIHIPLPLPTEIIDTLRVSISCFPETMLLCSSLSIETIRSHSRKLRYRAASLYSESPALADVPEQSKQPKWKWLPRKRQTSSPSQTPPSPLRNDFVEGCLDPKYGPSWPRKSDWSAIQNLFPSGTDYLCDALYAHLVAYNYVTSLCPRSALVNTASSRPSSKSSTAASELSLGLSVDLRTSVDMRSSTSDGTAIPQKAASLLGLHDDPAAPVPEPPTSRAYTLRNKRSFFAVSKSSTYPESSRPTTAAGGFGGRRPPLPLPPPPDHNEQILRDLRLGLARCISRLVATLRTTNGSTTTSIEGGGQRKREENHDFMRALCEIVRLSEERYM